MSYKFDSKEEALERFGSEIIKALKEANPQARKQAVKIFREIKDRDLLRKSPSFEESPLFEYAKLLESESDNDPLKMEALQLHGYVNESMVNCFNSYRDSLERGDTEILRSMNVESELLEDYLVVVDWFDYAMKQRRNHIKNKDSTYDSK
jgi:hypothetical protein